MTMTARPPVPSDVALALRQEAAFGCCKCGHPIYQYHHIVPWEEDHHFRPADMMIVCPNDHDEMKVTPRVRQYEIKAQPFNKAHGFPRGQLVCNLTELAFTLGSNLFIETPALLDVFGESIIEARRSSEGTIVVSLRLYDKQDRMIMRIADNVWEDGDNRAWDIEFKYNYLRLRAAKSRVLLELDMRESPAYLQGQFFRRGRFIEVTPSKFLVNSTELRVEMSNMEFRHCGLAVSLEMRHPSGYSSSRNAVITVFCD
jgi:hypothetical protein